MIGKTVLAALIAGMLAGLVLAGIQYVKLSPVIAIAETYERAAEKIASGAEVKCVETMKGMKMCPEDGAREWEPADGLQRSLFTTAASAFAGAGFALVLTGISLLTAIPINGQNGLIWGLCGFLAVAVAPAAGLSPELPGMPVAELLPRQFWWLGSITCTALAIFLFTQRPELWVKILAVLVLALPHVIGAPIAPEAATTVPPGLAAQFTGLSIAAAAIFWACIGAFLGKFLSRIELSEMS
jgi:cobalt transporter subunit CbtA